MPIENRGIHSSDPTPINPIGCLFKTVDGKPSQSILVPTNECGNCVLSWQTMLSRVYRIQGVMKGVACKHTYKVLHLKTL